MEHKSTITSGSRTLKSFIQDLIEVDIDAIESGCLESKNNNQNEFNENEEEYLLSKINQNNKNILL